MMKQQFPSDLEQPKISNLLEVINADPTVMAEIRAMSAVNGARMIAAFTLIVGRGGNIHRVNVRATAKRRAANRVARHQRRVNATR